MNWPKFFNGLSDAEKDHVAVLRVIECTNGVIQYAHRDSAPHALPIEETREAMQFSMGCMKRMEIPYKSGSVKFSPETEEGLREIRRLYISGVKNGDEKDFEEFFTASGNSVHACGIDRLKKAVETIGEEFEGVIPKHAYWGYNYLVSTFL